MFWCEQYLCKDFNCDNVISFLKSLDINNEAIHLIKDEVINIEFKKKKYHECQEWLIQFSIDIYEKYKLKFTEKLLTLKEKLDKNISIIDNSEYIDFSEKFNEKDIVIFDSYWNWVRQSIFNLDISELDNYELLHTQIINK